MSASDSELVRTTTGIRHRSSSSRSDLRTSWPSFRGMLRSNNTRSGRGLSAYSPSCRRNASVSTPSVATWRLLASFPCSSAFFVNMTSPGLSSASSISTGFSSVLMVVGLSVASIGSSGPFVDLNASYRVATYRADLCIGVTHVTDHTDACSTESIQLSLSRHIGRRLSVDQRFICSLWVGSTN